jgi:hypothetical protein
VFEQKVKTEVQTQSLALPKGTYFVDMNQENASLAIEVLEPEAANGFIRFGLLPTQLNAVLPIYRYLKNEKLF